MCRHTFQVFTCGCAANIYMQCPDSVRNNTLPKECPFIYFEKDLNMDVQCITCLIQERDRATKAMEDFHALEQASAAQPMYQGSLGTRVSRNQSKKSKEKSVPNYPSTGYSGTSALRSLDRKGKEIDRAEHPNYSIAEEEKDDDAKTIVPVKPQPPNKREEDDGPTIPNASHASQQPLEDQVRPPPLARTSKSKKLGRKISEKVKKLARKFSRKE